MAFENAFSGIDFGAPQRQSNLEQQQFQQMLGNAVSMYQQSKDRELKERQLEMKGDDFNLKRTAENALMKQNMGMPLNDQEKASIQTMSQVAPPTYSTDALGRTIAQPSGWSSVGGQPARQPMQMQENMGFDVQSQAPARAPQMPQGFQDIAGDGAYNIADEGMLPPVVGSQMVDPSVYQAGGMLAGTPKGEIMEEGFKKDVSLAQAKADIQFKKEQMKSDAGREKVRNTIETSMDKLQELNDKLKAKEAIRSNDSNTLSRLKNIYGTSWVGQQTTKVTDPQIESLRATYLKTRDSLMPAYIAFNDLPATVVDTKEIQDKIFEGFGDPALSYEVNNAALENMRVQFGLGKKEKQASKPTREQIIQELQRRKGK